MDSLDSPWPGLGGSHHLPPYSILCSSLPHLHPNGYFSRDSQSGVPKLSRFGLPGLWAFITSRPKLRSGRGLNQSCSSPRELFNCVSHSTCTHWNWVDSWLWVVGSQIANLTPGPSFDHNLCFKCPNGSYKAILDIYTSRPFQRYKKHLNSSVLTPAITLWVFESPGGLQVPFSGVWVATSTSLKVGLWHIWLHHLFCLIVPHHLYINALYFAEKGVIPTTGDFHSTCNYLGNMWYQQLQNHMQTTVVSNMMLISAHNIVNTCSNILPNAQHRWVTQIMLTWPCSCYKIAFVTSLQLCMAALWHAPVQHNIVINYGLILNVVASTRKYLHMQSFILIAI